MGMNVLKVCGIILRQEDENAMNESAFVIGATEAHDSPRPFRRCKHQKRIAE
jgi:hypothetical protein